MSNLVIHAQDELKRAGLLAKDSDYNGDLGRAALDIVKLFAKQGHSGMSASMTTSIVEKLMRFEPISPLTGADDEWEDVQSENGVVTYQNRRCGRVFKEGVDGKAYDIDGRVFRERDGSSFTGRGSRVYISFPYEPKTKYVAAWKRPFIVWKDKLL